VALEFLVDKRNKLGLLNRHRSAVRLLLLAAALSASLATALASEVDRKVLIRDVTQIQGVRDNQLVGYGLVIGLTRTGDTQQTFFTVQTLANALQRMGVQIAPGVVVVKNVAAVFVTATLPAFARSGMKIDVTVSSVGDAKSIQGGVLLLTALRAPNGEAYAEAQGPLVIGGYTEGPSGNSKTLNHLTVGRIADGGVVERDAAVDLSRFTTVSLLLLNSDFTAARDVADVINKEFGKTVAKALDSRRIDVDVAESGVPSVPVLISRVQNLSIRFRSPAKVVVNERTGTIVMGGDVKLSPVSVIHGSLTIDVQTTHVIVQPPPSFNGPPGKPEVVDETKTSVTDAPAQSIQLQEGANVDELIKGLHAIGATSHDIISILQAIKAAGGLEADLEVI
jgi:flagellar P-ring protein precursor FlgI